MNNLNDHVKKAALKKGLYAAFSPHGSIVDIVATRTKEQRGQAWVAFADVASAAAAMRALQGFPFYDKPMRLAYAREKSHAVQKLEGSFRPVPPEERERKKRRREEEGLVRRRRLRLLARPGLVHARERCAQARVRQRLDQRREGVGEDGHGAGPRGRLAGVRAPTITPALQAPRGPRRLARAACTPLLARTGPGGTCGHWRGCRRRSGGGWRGLCAAPARDCGRT